MTPDRESNNIAADALADQVAAAVREGEDLPDGIPTAAAVRLIDPAKCPPSLRQSTEALLDQWAEDNDVDRKFPTKESEP